jgi:Transglutaminase-like domain
MLRAPAGPDPMALSWFRRAGTGGGNRARALLRACIVFPLLVAGMDALSLDQLLSDPKMTPKKFAGLFADFSWDVHPFDVQDPEVFLSTRTGDCIDYAVLADYVLKRNGYDTRLIRVEMVGKNMGHAVCYVTQDRVYMDFNNRRYYFNLVHSGPSIREIATKVAASFDAHWTFASEFTYDYNTSIKKVVLTVVQTDPASMDPDAARYGAPRPSPNP